MPKLTAITLAVCCLAGAASAQDYRNSWNSPQIYSPNGQYLGNLNNNQFDPNSVSNPYGRYGNPYGNTVNNPYSQHGNPFSRPYIRQPSVPGWRR